MIPSKPVMSCRYLNNDASQTDLAELRISSNDPTSPELVVVLQAAP